MGLDENLLMSVLMQIPIVAIILWYMERRDRQWQEQLTRMNDQLAKSLGDMAASMDRLIETVSAVSSAENVARELADQFWGRGR